jgi:hypothetical protein
MAVHAAIFLITLSGIIFEIGLTRVYSATIWYHYAFVAVSVALLGWGLGGLVLHLFRRRVVVPTMEAAAVFTLLYAATMPLGLWLIAQFPFRMERLALYFAAPLVPFLIAGIVLSMLFHLRRETAARLYFADLCGGSAGALFVTFLLEAWGAETTLLLAAVPPLVAAACLSARWRTLAFAGAVVMVAAAISNETNGRFGVSPGPLKAMHQHMRDTPGTRVTQTGWNAYSRIDAVEGFPPPNLARFYIDSDAWTNALEWDGRLDSLSALRGWYRALPFRLAPPRAETLVIGPGGGSDVLVALAAGSRQVTAVELNPLMIEFVRHYGARAGHLYDRPEVTVVHDEGRSFVSRTDRKFDVIFLGFVDTWASVASGGLSLSENYLYTTEAFGAFYDRLSDDGVLAILRWGVDIPRLVSNTVTLLGTREAATRTVALLEKRRDPAEPSQMIFMLRKRPLTSEETAEIMGWPGVEPVIVPGRHLDRPYDALFSGRTSLEQLIETAPKRIGPVFDDSPFYFATERPWGIPWGMRRTLVPLVLLAALLLAGFVAFGKPADTPLRPYAASIVYFACLGAGFIAIELVLLQYFTLLLGNPGFTLSILLFTLLAAGGVGSALSGRVPMRGACLVVAGLAAAAAVALPQLIPAALPLTLPLRVAMATAVLVPLGLAMGMPFPQGLRRTGEGSLPPPPFYWGINGVMSVIGSVATIVVALVSGLQTAMLAGSVCYLLAAAASGAMRQ